MSEIIKQYGIDQNQWRQNLQRIRCLLQASMTNPDIQETYLAANRMMIKEKLEPMDPKEFVFWVKIVEDHDWIATLGYIPTSQLSFLKHRLRGKKHIAESKVYKDIVRRHPRKLLLDLTNEEVVGKFLTEQKTRGT